MLEQLIVIIHVLAAIAVVGLILLQQGKGADMGASFGSGASQTVLGVQGGGNLLTHSTAILTTVFFVTSLSLAYFAKQKSTISADQDVIVQELQKQSEALKNAEVPVTAPVVVKKDSEEKQEKSSTPVVEVTAPATVAPVATESATTAPVKDEIPE